MAFNHFLLFTQSYYAKSTQGLPKYFGCNDDLALMWPTIGMLLNKILELHP